LSFGGRLQLARATVTGNIVLLQIVGCLHRQGAAQILLDACATASHCQDVQF